MNPMLAKITFLQAAHAFAQSGSDADYSTMVLAAQDLQFALPAPKAPPAPRNTAPGTYTTFVVVVPNDPYAEHVERVKAQALAYRAPWAAERMAGI